MCLSLVPSAHQSCHLMHAEPVLDYAQGMQHESNSNHMLPCLANAGTCMRAVPLLISITPSMSTHSP